jgi:SnoaL-like domain
MPDASSSLHDLIAIDAIERLEARAGHSRILQPHMPVVEMTGDGSAIGRWAMFQYDHPRTEAPRDRRHRYVDLVVDYEREGNAWRAVSRAMSQAHEDSDDGPFPVVTPPQSLSGHWLAPSAVTTLDQLADLDEIRQLKARYFRYLDTKDWRSWRRVFTDDARFDVPGVASAQTNVDAFVEAVAAGMATTVTVHHGHAPELVLTGIDTASGIWALNDYVAFPTAPRAGDSTNGIRGFGHYEERYRRDGGAWKIAHLRLSYLRLDPLVRPAIPRADAGPAVSNGWLSDLPFPDPSRLVATRAIKELKARYFTLLDRKQWLEWRSLFTADAVYSADGQGERSVDAFVAGTREHLREAITVHHGHMPEIRFTGPHGARGIWAMFDYTASLPDRAGYAGYGHHQDEYRYEDGAWRIASTKLCRLRVDPLPDGRPLQAADL